MAVEMRTVKAVMVEGQAILDAVAVDDIVSVLRRGELVAYPTDTLYGLGADPSNPDALARLFAAKARPTGQPVSVVVPGMDAVKDLAVVSPEAETLCRRWLPGPLTLLFRPTAKAPTAVVSADGKLAVRVPDHPVALLLAKRFGPLTATSANRHGGPSPVAVEDARDQLGEAVEVYVDAGPCPVGRESTVVDLSGAEPRVMRTGAVSADRLGID